MDEIKTVVTERPGVHEAATEASQADGMTVLVMPAWQIVLVRTARVYLQSLVGFLTAGGTGIAGAVGVQMPVNDFWHLLLASASIAAAPAAITLIQNVIELLAKLDATKPGLRA